MKGENMKKERKSKTEPMLVAEMLPEYHFDYSKAKPNRFASHFKRDVIIVPLDPDIAEVFKTKEEVNRILRALITHMPATRKRKIRTA
jgi:hypothetical protein